MAAAATVRKPPAPRAARSARAAAAAPRTVPARKPARKASPAHRPRPVRPAAPTRRPGGQLIPLAVGTAAAVRGLPDSSLMVRMTRGRTWIGVLGLLLAGIVALNVVTLSIAATAGKIGQNIQALDKENSFLRSQDAQKSGTARVRHEAAALGLAMGNIDQAAFAEVDRNDAAIAAQRLAAASAGY
jgi:hypothetical protein